MTTTSYILVSYARTDHEIVNEIISGLKNNGIEVWVDVEDILPGQLWESQISRALEDASGLLVFVSPNSMKSDFVR